MATKIIQCGYMSGDTYAAAALLAIDPDVRIILVRDTKGTGQYEDKSGMIKKIYKESGVDGRVTEMDISTTGIAITALWKSVSDAHRVGKALPDAKSTDALVQFQRRLCNEVEPKRTWPRSITSVTGLLATKWEADPDGTQAAVAKAWKVGELPTEQKFALYEYMATVFGKTNFDIRENIVVLWSRQSGKRGGAHLELDSSYKGIRQLARVFAEEDKRATVVLSGDEKNQKMENFAKESVHIVNATNMWEAAVWDKMFGKCKFLAQFAFYKYLAGDYNVVHVGMRSGMLEAMALLGMTVFYLEVQGSGSGDRMLAFSRSGITYTRVQIEDPPGLTGRISESNRLYKREDVDRSITRVATANKSRPGFQNNFTGHGVPEDDIEWAATNYAKAKLLNQPLNDRSYNTGNQWNKMAEDMGNKRGFTKESVTKIVKLVTDTFK